MKSKRPTLSENHRKILYKILLSKQPLDYIVDLSCLALNSTKHPRFNTVTCWYAMAEMVLSTESPSKLWESDKDGCYICEEEARRPIMHKKGLRKIYINIKRYASYGTYINICEICYPQFTAVESLIVSKHGRIAYKNIVLLKWLLLSVKLKKVMDVVKLIMSIMISDIISDFHRKK